jgi:hypothetical protein
VLRCFCQVRISQELVHGQKVQALVAERDRIELREALRDLQEKVSQNSLRTRVHAPYRLPSNIPEEPLYTEMVGPLLSGPNISSHSKQEINDTRPFTFDDDEFDHAVRRFCTSLETCERKKSVSDFY